MKKLNKYIMCLAVAGGLVSCEDKMDFADYNQLPQEEFWLTSEHAMQALTSCYGSFTSHDGTAANGDVTGNWNNIYIVSSAPCTVTSANKVIDGENTAAFQLCSWIALTTS